jgi:hypothetical protein
MLAASRDDGRPTRDASFRHDSSRPVQWIWYTFGGRLGPLHGGWVLHDTTCRTRWLRQAVRAGAQVSVPAVIVLVVLRFSWIAWVAVALGLLLALWYSITYINLTADERLVRHGYLPGTLQQVLDERKPARMSSMSR